jgi:hypothetical protein
VSVPAVVESLRRLLELAEDLKRSNLSKLRFDEQAWQAVVNACGIGEEPGELVRRARNVARRLGNAGRARFQSYGVGRDPDSSADGARFHRDLEVAREVLRELETPALR